MWRTPLSPAAEPLAQGAHDFFELCHAQLPVLVFVKYSRKNMSLALNSNMQKQKNKNFA